MRLLEFSSGDDLTLTSDFSPNEIPQYAILSHTWGGPEDKVTLQDVVAKREKEKPGYQKIVFGGRQARSDGLRYFWVDTCYFDKTSSAELTEAINSMFLWYRKAERCYVYLADVEGDGLSQPSCRQSFQTSRCHSRGWTLQELIAPDSVEFFSAIEILLDDKNGLAQECASGDLGGSSLSVRH
jgi:hypothetical protein